jgi:hypothetical protein
MLCALRYGLRYSNLAVNRYNIRFRPMVRRLFLIEDRINPIVHIGPCFACSLHSYHFMFYMCDLNRNGFPFMDISHAIQIHKI